MLAFAMALYRGACNNQCMPRWLLLLLISAIALGGAIVRSQAPRLPEGAKDAFALAASGPGDSSAIIEANDPQPVSCSTTSTAPTCCPLAVNNFLRRAAGRHAPPHRWASDSTLLAQHVLLRI
jgi:hypothetical protein